MTKILQGSTCVNNMNTSRKRKNVYYNDDSSQSKDDNDYTIFDIKSTSNWTSEITRLLKIQTEDLVDLFKDAELPQSELVISEWIDGNWLENVNILSLNKYSNKVKTLIGKIRNVYKAMRTITEVYVDGFMDSLLHIMNFDDYPCFVYPQYQYTTKILDHLITAKSDFSVLTESHRMLLVIEDKTVNNATYSNNWKEDQVLGELFVAVHNTVANHPKSEGPMKYPVTIYAVRVVGTVFTFYKTDVTKEYIKESAKDIPSKNTMLVQRHPPVEDDPSNLTGYDICEIEDRKNILKCLDYIRKSII